jgi:pyruvate,water dikinase
MGVVLGSARLDALVPEPVTLPLEGLADADPAVAGAKATNLGRAIGAGLPVLPGFVITTGAVARLSSGWRAAPRQVTEDLALAWSRLSDNGRRPLVVRSSSPVEDQSGSSMAGRFTSIVDVRDWAAFRSAVEDVARSAHQATAQATAPDRSPAMAVLVQPHLDPRLSGVLFGLDPLSGRMDRRLVAAVEGGPQQLVSGEVDGTRYLLGPRGRLIEVDGAPLPLRRSDRRALAALARRAAEVFGGPQDVEWARAEDGAFWLLQARPVTAAAEQSETGAGPRFGPGPVAETFPDPLGPLEEDLWVEPLRRALAESLRLTGAASRRKLAASPVLVTVQGRVAADLDLTGAAGGPTTLWSRLDPRPPLRRLRAAWTVGRLRAALPSLAADITASVDAELTAVPPLTELTDDALLLILQRAGGTLTAVHGYEMLAGLLPDSPLTAASLALDALAAGRAEGLSDDDIIALRPEVLTLSAPAITGTSLRLPATVKPPAAAPLRRLEDLEPREALRLRARWLHELTARVALELGVRLAARGALGGPGDAGLLTLAEFETAIRQGTVPPGLESRRLRLSPPLPAEFHLAGQRVNAIAPAPARSRNGRGASGGRNTSGGRGASAGRAVGPVSHGPLPAPPGSVLVVTTLDPGLAPYLEGLAGLVAETGNALSHLAILAREQGLPCVVGCAGALQRFPAGTAVAIDGTTGEVSAVEGAAR